MAQIRKTTNKTVKIPVGLYPHELLYGQAGKENITKAINNNKNSVSIDIDLSFYD